MKRSRESSNESLEELWKKYQKMEDKDKVFLDACREGDLECVKRCLSLRQVNVEARDHEFGWSGIHWAAKNGHVDVVKVLIQTGAHVNAVDDFKRTALHRVAWTGHAEVVKVLIRNGTHVNAVQKQNCTALHKAASSGHVDVVSILLKNGAELNAVTKETYYSPCVDDTRSALFLAAKYVVFERVQFE